MGRPRRLTDTERKASGAERQRRYKARHGWVARERQKQSMRALRARRKEALGVTTAQVNNRKPFHDDALLPLGELHTGPIEGVDVWYGEMEPNLDGGRQHSPARATSGGTHRSGDGPKPAGACPTGSELTSGLTDLGPAPLEDAPGASLTANERSTYARLEEFKARRAQREKGVQVELIL